MDGSKPITGQETQEERPTQEKRTGKEKGEPRLAFSEHFSIPNRENHAYLCVAATVAGCCKRNSSSVSLGTFTC